MPIRNKLSLILEERQLTQSEVARRIKVFNKDITRATISNICREKYNPSLELAFEIAEVLNLTVIDIFSYERAKTDK